jgi:hypothetical protein
VSTTAAAYSRFRGKVIGPIRFSRRGEFLGGRAASKGGPGAHTMPWRGQGGPCHGVVWPPSGAPLSHLRTSSRVEKIGTLAFVSSNSENISYVAFLKHKNSRKQGTGTVASR